MKVDKNTKVIRDWLDRHIKNSGWVTSDDLHITEVWPNLPKFIWITKGIELLEIVRNILDEKKLTHTVVLGISLISTNTRSIPLRGSLKSLKSVIDDQPPSVYVFPPEWKAWRETCGEAIQVRFADSNNSNLVYYYYRPYNINEEEFSRTIFVEFLPLKIIKG